MEKVFVAGLGMAQAGWQVSLKDNNIQSAAPGCPAAAQILGEALVVLVVGITLALAANQISPRGLALARNYFPAGPDHPPTPLAGVGPRREATNSPALLPAELLAVRLQEQGLRLIDGHRAGELFHDPRYLEGRIVFIDARDEAHYREGHIPGAFEFDPYYPEKYFPVALPPCQAAEQIVVYCHGGDCDDSESAALTLRDVGIAINKLYIYGGGITEWTSNGWPVEAGERNGGKPGHLDK